MEHAVTTDADAASPEAMPRRFEVLSVHECLELLRSHEIGRVAYIEADRPQVLPVTYRFHLGAVVFRTAYGGLLEAVHRKGVAFEVDSLHPIGQTAWSVVVHGTAEEISQPEELGMLRELALHPWAPGTREHYVQIFPRAITGRRITAGAGAETVS